jgi:hypothetical protein
MRRGEGDAHLEHGQAHLEHVGGRRAELARFGKVPQRALKRAARTVERGEVAVREPDGFLDHIIRVGLELDLKLRALVYVAVRRCVRPAYERALVLHEHLKRWHVRRLCLRGLRAGGKDGRQEGRVALRGLDEELEGAFDGLRRERGRTADDVDEAVYGRSAYVMVGPGVQRQPRGAGTRRAPE